MQSQSGSGRACTASLCVSGVVAARAATALNAEVIGLCRALSAKTPLRFALGSSHEKREFSSESVGRPETTVKLILRNDARNHSHR